MTIDPIRSSPPPAGSKPFTVPVVFFHSTGETDDGERQWEEVTEDLQCRPFVNAGALMGMDAMYGRSRSAQGPGAIYDLFDAALLPDSRARWHQVRYSEEYYIHGDAVSALAVRLYEVYTARPTESPADS